MTRQARLGGAAVVLAAVAVGAAACGGSSGGTQSVTAAHAAVSAARLVTHHGPDGAYLTDAKGRTVYIFSADSGGTSACSGSCASEWPPVKTAGGKQMVFDGHPVYYFSGDSAAGDMKGEGLKDFGGTWTAVTPSGTPLMPSGSGSGSNGSSTSTTSSGSSSEWG
jgi:predicted lipoprotein with Yx(FWY)xxD motif